MSWSEQSENDDVLELRGNPKYLLGNVPNWKEVNFSSGVFVQ